MSFSPLCRASFEAPINEKDLEIFESGRIGQKHRQLKTSPLGKDITNSVNRQPPKKSKKRNIFTTSVSDLHSLFTPEQKKKFEAMVQNLKK